MRAAFFVCLGLVSAPLSATDNAEIFDSSKALHEEQAVAAAWKSFFDRTSPTLPIRTDSIIVINPGAATTCARSGKAGDERT